MTLVLGIGIVLALAAAVFRLRPVLSARMAVALTAALVVCDQSRLQPWVYQYCAMLAVLSFARREEPAGPGNAALTLTTCRFIVVALYFWSAIQKANVTFLTWSWKEFVNPVSALGPPAVASLIMQLGALVPLVELLVAIGLLTARFRRPAIYAAIAVHVCVLSLLVISGENSVVWPWNAAMAILTVLLFGKSDVTAVALVRNAGFAPHRVIAPLFGVMPLLGLFGYWDAYLSAALYSGNVRQAVVYVTPDVAERLPPVIRRNTWRESVPMFIDLNRWSYDELNVPAYPADRVFKRIGGEVCRTYVHSGAGSLRILDRPDWRTGRRGSETYDCAIVDAW